MLSRSVISDSLRPRELLPTRFLCPQGFYRQEYWSGLPCPPPGDLLNPGIKPRSPALQADFFTDWATREAKVSIDGTKPARVGLPLSFGRFNGRWCYAGVWFSYRTSSWWQTAAVTWRSKFRSLSSLGSLLLWLWMSSSKSSVLL